MPKIGGETSFLLALPNGDDATAAHAKLRALVFKYCAGPAAIARARPRDPVAAALLWKLRTSCAEDPANAANVHFPTFVVRFVHWAAGLDDRACGRICPGRDLALELVVSVLQVMRAPSDDDARRLLGVGPAFDGAP
ncbi:hypothetical protein JL722_4516 [Aureococcus anophagefferens]|nr:hypothetical protein JL722_4516 [Aureococcus anophagefferens]